MPDKPLIKPDKYWGFFGWAFITGLFLGILIAHGQDISQEGILSTILSEINKVMPIPAYFWLQIMLFAIGMASLIGEIYLVWIEGWLVRIMVAATFLSILCLVTGVAWQVSFIQNIGVFLLFIGIVLLIIKQALKGG